MDTLKEKKKRIFRMYRDKGPIDIEICKIKTVLLVRKIVFVTRKPYSFVRKFV